MAPSGRWSDATLARVTDEREHWDRVWASKPSEEMSWFQPEPQP